MITLINYLQEIDTKFDKNIEMWGVAKLSTEGCIDELKSFLHDCIKEAFEFGIKDSIKIIENQSDKHKFEEADAKEICQVCGKFKDEHDEDLIEHLQHLTNKEK